MSEIRPQRSRSRSASPRRSRPGANYIHRHSRSGRHKSSKTSSQRSLPFQSPLLSRDDFKRYTTLFSLYLDVQKGIDSESITESELKGRWKSFVGHWNRGELAEGWYDPSVKERADNSFSDDPLQARRSDRAVAKQEEESEDDEVGPVPPVPGQLTSSSRAGPLIPQADDLALRDELHKEDRAERIEDLRFERKQDRRSQKDKLDELVPRADPGSRDRQIEKKKEVRESVQSFRDAGEGGAMELGDAEIMGGADGIDDLKRHKAELQRKKNERELRREEVLRARAQEREERMKEHAVKEEKTMAMLKALAKKNFG